ncbi:MAG: DUF4249 domain-containing protein [Ferruginibacter sp.]|nr:DUF4249 domain-containing protein [Ferruginibacter sp.]
MHIFLIFLFLITFASCEKNIDFKLNEVDKALVVEAEIENDREPRVVLTRSQSFFSTLSPELLANAFVRNADVYISNGSLNHKLKEYSFPIFPGLNGYYYGIDTDNLSTAFKGEFNTTYKLKIISEGKEYNAITTIPKLTKVPDSLFFKKAPNNPDTLNRILFMKFTDPKGLGNYIRYFTQRNNEPFLPGQNSVFSDEVIDGTTYVVQVPQGVDRNNPPEPTDGNFFRKADVVTLKFCNIDRSTYLFWNTWEFSLQSIGNPFAQPGKVLGNISNGALGSFCGYAAWYKTVTVD